MKTEHINSTQVRHKWKSIVRGLASGNRYVVENFGKPEAIVISPNEKTSATRFDLDDFFVRVRSLPPVRLADVEITRSSEL